MLKQTALESMARASVRRPASLTSRLIPYKQITLMALLEERTRAQLANPNEL